MHTLSEDKIKANQVKISQGCVLTLAPPLIISPKELNLAMDKLEYALTQVFRHNI